MDILRELSQDTLKELLSALKTTLKERKPSWLWLKRFCTWISKRNCRSQCCGNGCEFVESNTGTSGVHIHLSTTEMNHAIEKQIESKLVLSICFSMA